MVFMVLAGVAVAFLAARALGGRPGGAGMGMLAVLVGVVAGEAAMIAAAFALNAFDPANFPPGLVLSRATGNVWLALAGACLGLGAGCKSRRAGEAASTIVM
jgi:hypothetical protein